MTVLGWRDLCARPWPIARGETRTITPGQVSRKESDGRLIIEQKDERSTSRWIVDRQTGFVHAEAERFNGPPDVVGHILWQYGPKRHANGVVLPTVRVLVQLLGSKVLTIDLVVIESAEFGIPIEPADFAMAVPPGTVIVDDRRDAPRPKQRMCRQPEADVMRFVAEDAPGR